METTKISTRTRYHRPRLSRAAREALQMAALERAQDGRVCANDLLIIATYAARGIDAHPRVDVFTFAAWKALHRHVRRSEHGVHIASYARREEVKPDGTTEEHSFPTSAVVFHVSQTDADQIGGE